MADKVQAGQSVNSPGKPEIPPQASRRFTNKFTDGFTRPFTEGQSKHVGAQKHVVAKRRSGFQPDSPVGNRSCVFFYNFYFRLGFGAELWLNFAP